jgi:hypothetical protein
VLCIHRDGTVELEDGTDACCPASGGGALANPAAIALADASPDGCPGCEDILLSKDGCLRSAPKAAVLAPLVATGHAVIEPLVAISADTILLEDVKRPSAIPLRI